MDAQSPRCRPARPPAGPCDAQSALAAAQETPLGAEKPLMHEAPDAVGVHVAGHVVVATKAPTAHCARALGAARSSSSSGSSSGSSDAAQRGAATG